MIFFVEKMRKAFAFFTTKKIWDLTFEILTNEMVSFEQPNPDVPEKKGKQR